MKRLLLSSAIVLALGAGGGYFYKAAADTNPPGPPAGPGAPAGPWAGGWGGPRPGMPGPNGFGRGREMGRDWGPRGDDKFSLFAPVQDKKLSLADVKTIATGILLEHGNHGWTVSDVAAQADKSIDFSYITPHGDVIATFAIDPASGRIRRVS